MGAVAMLVATVASCLWLFPPPWIITTAGEARLAAKRRGKPLVLITRVIDDGIEFCKNVMLDPRVKAEDFVVFQDFLPSRIEYTDVYVEGHAGKAPPKSVAMYAPPGQYGHAYSYANVEGPTGPWNVTISKSDGTIVASFTPDLPHPVTAEDMIAWIRHARGEGSAPERRPVGDEAGQ